VTGEKLETPVLDRMKHNDSCLNNIFSGLFLIFNCGKYQIQLQRLVFST